VKGERKENKEWTPVRENKKKKKGYQLEGKEVHTEGGTKLLKNPPSKARLRPEQKGVLR